MTPMRNVQTALVIPGNNDRKEFDPQALAELAASIAEHGLAQPITVRPWGAKCERCGHVLTPTDLAHGATLDCACGGRIWSAYEIVAGERRFRAVTEVLGWTEVPAIVRKLDDETASAIMLAENVSRADLNPIEEANAYQSRITTFGWTVAKLAEKAGASEQVIERRLQLLALHPDIQKLVADRHLPLGHAEALYRLDHYRQLIALRVYREAKAMPLATFTAVVSDLLAEQSQESLFDIESFWMTQAAKLAVTPTRGKKAIVDVPTRPDLPAPTINSKDNTSAVIMRYIQDLERLGHYAEAGAIGTLYRALIHSNSMALPDTY